MTIAVDAPRLTFDKVAIVGGGSFRVPMVVRALDAVAPVLDLDEIVLHDIDDDRAARMALVVRGMRARPVP